jgi:hypothetical protein
VPTKKRRASQRKEELHKEKKNFTKRIRISQREEQNYNHKKL